MNDEQQAFFLPSSIPAELISQILAFLDSEECKKLLHLNHEWRHRLGSFLTSCTINMPKTGPLMAHLDTKRVTSLTVLALEDYDYAPTVDWIGKFTNLRNLILIPEMQGAVEKLAPLLPLLTSLRLSCRTDKEIFHMTNLRALSVGIDEDDLVLKGLVNMHKLHTLHLRASISTSHEHFDNISHLTTLTHLTLRHCEILEEIFLHVTALTKLKELIFDSKLIDSNYKSVNPQRIRELTVLRDLEVLQMDSMTPGDTDLIEFEKLTRISIAQMPLSFELPPNLKAVKFHNCLNINKLVDKFTNLESLQVIDKSGDSYESISKLKQLTMLSFLADFNKKMQQGLTSLTLLPRLKVLKISIAPLKTLSAEKFATETILEIISNIPSLIEFHCDNDNCLDNIREKVPHMLCL